MTIDKDTVVSVTYALTVDGQIVDSTDENRPLTFLCGHRNMIDGFERQLIGKTAGEDYSFSVTADEGYGQPHPDMVLEVPMQVFMQDGNVTPDLKVGNVLNMQDQNGTPMRGQVVEIGQEAAKLDFNHPLAGKDLAFEGKVLEVRAAEAEEIAHGHVHGPGGHQH